MDSEKVVLVTGASSGIGRATARRFADAGYRVFGGSRRNAEESGVEHVPLDICDDESVERGIAEVIARAGHVDILVNNAGYTIMGAIEETSIEQARALFDTNFFGAVRVTAAVLPHMRSQKRGRVVNVSSVLGFLAAPYMGFYSASKFAMEGWSLALDHEVRSRGVRVVLVQPGFTRTGIDQNAQRGGVAIADYEEEGARVIAGIGRQVAAAMAPEAVAATIFAAGTVKSPKLQWRAGREAKTLGLLSAILPRAAVNSAVRKTFLLDRA